MLKISCTIHSVHCFRMSSLQGAKYVCLLSPSTGYKKKQRGKHKLVASWKKYAPANTADSFMVLLLAGNFLGARKLYIVVVVRAEYRWGNNKKTKTLPKISNSYKPSWKTSFIYFEKLIFKLTSCGIEKTNGNSFSYEIIALIQFTSTNTTSKIIKRYRHEDVSLSLKVIQNIYLFGEQLFK